MFRNVTNKPQHIIRLPASSLVKHFINTSRSYRGLNVRYGNQVLAQSISIVVPEGSTGHLADGAELGPQPDAAPAPAEPGRWPGVSLGQVFRLANWPFALKMAFCPALAMAVLLGMGLHGIIAANKQATLISVVVHHDLATAMGLSESATR